MTTSNWQKKHSDFESIKQGSPSSYWSYGLQKRLDLATDLINFNGEKILDAGCGIGIFMEKFSEFSDHVYGFDVDKRKIDIAKKSFKNVIVAGEGKLPYENNMFDIIWSHEVLEHVNDDKEVLKELVRVLKPGGELIVFTPNRLWPIETHGIYIGNHYEFGNIPFVTWLPNFIYKKLTPHVRNYFDSDINNLLKNLPLKVIHHKHVFPGFDGLVGKIGMLGKITRKLLNVAEKTPLHFFGISHFLIIEKV